MTRARDSFCSYCGAASQAPPGKYPRTCQNADCGVVLYANPIPVSVVLLPCQHEGRTGLLVIRRGIEPRRGHLALPGGFVEEHETAAAAGAREVLEEAGVSLDPATVQPFWFASSEPRPNRVLLFSIAAEIGAATLPPFAASVEASERGLAFGPEGLDEVFAFPLHAEAARRFFASRGLRGQHAFQRI